MNGSEPELTAEDHSYRHAADAYFKEKSGLARASFDPHLLGVFQTFEEHWRDFFAPSDPEPLLEYLHIPFEMRTARFERFKRECRAWEVSFRLCKRPAAGASSQDSEMSDLRRRLDDQRTKADQVRQFYDNLDSMLDRERQRQSHPLQLMAHLRLLELPSDASLEDIKRSYKRLARVHHPDVSGDARMMSKLNNAYRAILAFYKVA